MSEGLCPFYFLSHLDALPICPCCCFVPGCWEMSFPTTCAPGSFRSLLDPSASRGQFAHLHVQLSGLSSAVAPSLRLVAPMLVTRCALNSFPHLASSSCVSLCQGFKPLPRVSWGTHRTYHVCPLSQGLLTQLPVGQCINTIISYILSDFLVVKGVE